MKWFDETLHDQVQDQGFTQRFEVTRVVHRERTEFQDLIIFETPAFGRVLALDGIVQTTEGDEFAYHEMLVHVPMFAHRRARRVLILGGGDGGTLREVLRHDVEAVIMVEIDRAVVDACRAHVPSLSAGAFEDARTELVIADAAAYVADGDQKFDVIIVDSTDPVGPGAKLFLEKFYADAKQRLAAGGVLVAQNGVPFLQSEEITTTYRRLAPLFADVGFYVTAVPTYVGGLMTLAWATDDAELRLLSPATLAERYAAAGFETRYYTPGVHVASFALPPYVTRLMG